VEQEKQEAPKRVQGLHDPVGSMKQDPQSIGRQPVEAPQELMRTQLVQRHIQQEVKPPQTRSKWAIMQVLAGNPFTFHPIVRNSSCILLLLFQII
jgi:hypothetical protein